MQARSRLRRSQGLARDRIERLWDAEVEYGPAVALVDVFARAGAAAERLVRRWMPDPFVLVLLLTLVSLVLGYFKLAGASFDASKASSLVMVWTGGFGNAEILKFGL